MQYLQYFCDPIRLQKRTAESINYVISYERSPNHAVLAAVNALYTCCDHANVMNELLNVMVVGKNARPGLYAHLCNLRCEHGTESVYALLASIDA